MSKYGELMMSSKQLPRSQPSVSWGIIARRIFCHHARCSVASLAVTNLMSA